MMMQEGVKLNVVANYIFQRVAPLQHALHHGGLAALQEVEQNFPLSNLGIFGKSLTPENTREVTYETPEDV